MDATSSKTAARATQQYESVAKSSWEKARCMGAETCKAEKHTLEQQVSNLQEELARLRKKMDTGRTQV